MSINHNFTTEIVCPFCRHPVPDSWEISPDEDILDCSFCWKTFYYCREVEVTYSTSRQIPKHITQKMAGGEE
jgi:hypothetical protein